MSLINEALKRASQVQKTKPDTHASTPAMKPAESRQRRPWPSWVVPLGLVLVGAIGGVLIWQGMTAHRSPATAASANTTEALSTELSTSPKPTPASVAKAAPPAEPAPKLTATRPASTVTSTPGSTDVQSAPPAIRDSATAPVPAEAAVKSGPEVASQTQSVPSTAANAASAAQPGSIPAAVPPAASSPPSTPVAAPTPPIPAASTSSSFPELKLQGIFYRLSNPTVMINGQTLGIGDSIAGVRISKIERQSVTVEMRGQRKVLVLR